MATHTASLSFAFFLLTGGLATAGAWIDSYWPLNDGDAKTFIYGGTNQLTMNTADNGGGEYEISDDSPDGSAAEFYEDTGTGIYLDHAEANSGWIDVYLNPPVRLLTDAMLQNGGSASTSTTVSQPGGSYPATFTIAVSLGGTVVVPAGSFANCRNITVTEKATVPGQGTVTVNAMTAVLAPSVGIIRKLVRQGVWANLVSGTVGGTDVRILASGPPALTIQTPANGQRIATGGGNVAVTGSVGGYAPGMQVFFQVNSGAWVAALVVGTNWSGGSVQVQPGTNTINAYALDSVGRQSPTARATFQYVVTGVLSVQAVGKGSISPNYSNAVCEIGRAYTITATPVAGYAFTNWTAQVEGNVVLTTNKAALHFVMRSNLVLTATFVDVQKPVLTITTPAANERWSNAVFSVAGKVTDNGPAGTVWYQLNTGAWNTASGWSNWTAGVTLTPGTNTVTAFAVDAAGNRSTNSSRKVVYVLSAPLGLVVVGKGAVSGASNGQMLELGKRVTLTAKPATGYVLTNWLVTVDNATVVSTNRTVPFLMQSNLVLTATFVDAVRPACTIVSPTASAAHSTNGLVTVQVRATDNVAVANVAFYLNGQNFGSGLGLGSNLWTMDFALAVGTNAVSAVATDFGDNSATNTIQLVYKNMQTNANVITLAESHFETDLPSPPGLYNFIIQDTGVLNASLPVPALQSMSADTWSNLFLTVSFGDLSFAGSLLEADVLTTTQAVFHLPYAYGVQLTVARSGNTLLMAARISNPPDQGDGSHVYLYTNYWYADGPPPALGPFQDQQPFNLLIQDGDTSETYANVRKTIYITGKITQINSEQPGRTLLAQVTGETDYTPPAISITAPVKGQVWSNAVLTVKGTARDNVGVSSVWCQLNNAGWNLTSTTNNWLNWTAAVTLTPGTNTIAAYAVDASGNFSVTNFVNIIYVVSAVLNVQIVGEGTVTPNYNGQLLAIGTTRTMKATGTNGCAFYYWSGGVPMSANSTLTFTMASNLTIIANFKDVTLPVKPTITFPTANQKCSNSVITVTGKARDNVGVARVWVQINDTGWSAAGTLNGFTNWSAANLPVSFGTNIVRVCTVDAAGNVSLTNAIKLIGVVAPPLVAPASLAGYAAIAKPSGGKPNIAITWGDSTWAQTGTGNDTNVNDYCAGSYTYIPTVTNTALLTNVDIGLMSALGITNVTTVDLTFTSATTADYAWSSDNDSGSGTMTFSHVSNLLPASLGGKTLSARGSTITFNSNGTFNEPASVHNGGTAANGTFTFTPYSPTVAILQLNYDDPNDNYFGAVAYAELTFTSPTNINIAQSWYSNPSLGSYPDNWGLATGTIK